MDHRRNYPTVPRATSVVPGAGVNVVLKADQPTGRTVAGVVRDVLTRGDHPRGIKVRLSDGRVGRVQSMLPAGSASRGGDDAGGGGDGGGGGGGGGEGGDLREDRLGSGRGERPWRGGRRGGRGEGGASRGNEEGVEQGLPPQQIGLDAYVREARPRRKGKRNQTLAAQEEEQEGQEDRPGPSSETITCPVCGAFEGDEGAVSHHVAGHFDSAS